MTDISTNHYDFYTGMKAANSLISSTSGFSLMAQMVSTAYVLLAFSLAVVSATPLPQAAESSNASSDVIAPIDQVGETLAPISDGAGQLAAEVPGEGGSGTSRAATSEGGNGSGSGLYDPAVLVLMPYVMPPAAGGQSGSSSSSGSSSEGSSSGASQSSGTSGETKGAASGEAGKSTTENGSASSSSSTGGGKAAGEQGSTGSTGSSSGSEGGSKQNTASQSGSLTSPSATGLMAQSGASFNAGVSFIVAALTLLMAF
ncbi:hypothetical protein HDU81_003107 [Chytriomyces hyalinus]|nr:hypothetical protein HDU81_003107 [Chytriomyces hyalinus]